MTAECLTLDRNLRRRGAMVLALFAFVWAVAGTSGVGAAALPVAAGAAAVSVGVVVTAHRSGDARARERVLPRRWGRWVGVVNIAQAAAILAVVLLLVNLGLVLWLPAAVCLIVGLHFFPLAPLYDQRQYRWTAALLIAVAAAGFALAASGAGTGAVLSAVGLAAALVLWGSAAHVAVRN